MTADRKKPTPYTSYSEATPQELEASGAMVANESVVMYGTSGSGTRSKTATARAKGTAAPHRTGNPSGITHDLKRHRETLGLTQHDMAKMMLVGLRTYHRWEQDTATMDHNAQVRLREITQLTYAIQDLVQPQYIQDWFMRPIPQLGDLSVYEAFARGDSGKIWRMLYELEAGIPD